MSTYLVRLKPYDPRRGHLLQRFTYAGIKFHEARGWYRVEPDVAEYLRTVHQRPSDQHTPFAFDVCTDDEARALEQRDKEAATPRKTATDDIQLSPSRGDGVMATPRRTTIDDLPTARGDGTGTPPRRTTTDDLPASLARVDRAVATAGPPEPASDKKPTPIADMFEPAKDDKKPAPTVAAKKERP